MYRCRILCSALLFLLLCLPLWAANEEAGRNPGNPLDQGGETCATAVAITTLPFCDTGTTANHINDYPVPCNTGSAAPDVVYSITPPVTSVLSFSLCGSAYNTALTIWRGCPSAGGVLICCSDNVCGDDACCSAVTLLANVQYFVVVDGGSTAPIAGNYQLNVVQGEACPNTPCAQDTCPLPSRDIEPVNDNCGTNTPNVTCGERLCGEISTAADRDWYRFSFTQFPCADIRIDIFGDDTPGHWPFGQGLNPKVSLWTSDCLIMVAQDDDGGLGLDALLDSLCIPAGSYFILVESSAGVGPYELALTCAGCDCPSCPYPDEDNEPNNVCAAGGGVLSCGDTLCGHITPGIDGQDYYYLDIQGPGCQNVTIDVFGDDTPGYFPFGQGLNPTVYLVNILCDSTIAVDFNSGVGEDARIDSVCLPTGLYRVYVSGDPANQSFGPYIISLACAPCECPVCPYPDQDLEPNNVCSGGGAVIACGDTTCGDITPNGDNDYYYFRVDGPSCQLVTIDVFADDTPGQFPFGQGLNPLLVIYTPGCGAVVASDTMGGIGEDARLQLCLEPGTYRVLVRQESDTPLTFGPYILATSCTPCECPDTCNYFNRDYETINNTCGTFNPQMVCDDTLCGNLSAADVVDWYLVTVVGGGSIRLKVDVFGNDTPGFYPFGLGLNPMVAVYGAGCTTLLGVDNDSGIGNDPHLEICLTQGTYNIAVSYEGGAFGPYIIATACEPCDTCPYPSLDVEPLNNNCGTFNPIIHCNDALCGEIVSTVAADEDWYVLQITECTQLFIDVLGDDTPGFYPFGRGLNPAVELITADCSGGLYSDTDSGVGEDARLTTACLEPGIYMLHVIPEFGTQGPYILFIGCESCTCPPPCDITCPPGALIEEEPCPVLIDTVNGGCDTEPYRFTRIECGQTYCATSSRLDSYRDSDWYVFGLAQPSQVRICVTSEFDGRLWLYNRSPSVNPCSEGVDLIECLAVRKCEGFQCISVCLPRGIYMIDYAPAPGETLFTCRDYQITLDCSPCVPTVCEAPDSVVIHYPDTLGAGDELEDIVLYWPPVTGADEYRIYRTSNNNDASFVPSPLTFVATTTDTFFVHENVVSVGVNEIWIYYVVSYCRYGGVPCDVVPTAVKPQEPQIITPRE